MKHLKFKHAVGSALMLLVACSPSPKTDSKQVPDLSVEQLNNGVKPGDNFYAYANTTWMKNNPLPDDKSRYGSFDELSENNKEKLKIIFEEAQKNSTPNSVAKKIGDFYNSGMDSLAVEKEGLTNLSPILNQIKKVKNTDDLAYTIGYLHTYQLYPFFYIYAGADDKNSSMNIAHMGHNGIGLPDRDYYLQKDEESIKVQEAYRTFLNKILSFEGNDEATASEYSKKIYDLEYLMAETFYTRLQNRDPHLTYNKIKGSELATAYPDFNWAKYFEALPISTPNEINIAQVPYFKQLGKIIGNQDIEVVKKYLEAFVIRNMTSYLSSAYVNASFDFYGKTIQGTQTMQPRWKRVQGTTNAALGEAIGQLFVEKYFPARAKERMVKLVENLRHGFKQRIENLEWMGEETKAAAEEKLAAITVKIGYPNKWRDYSKLEVVSDSYVKNVLASNQFDFNFNIEKIGKPVDKEEWHMSPQTVNAYYNPSVNEIVFPAAILQPPFFYLDGDDAVNYGAIGVVIGHEMTHGFDDQGAKYDKEGNLKTWWTEEDTEKFNARTKVLAEQFNKFTVIDTLKANGEFTLGENIADLGGLNISYTAYLNAIKGKGELPEIGGLSDKERFYLSYAGIWAQNIRDKEIIRRTKTDPHSLGKFRVNGPLPNIQEFYDTFGIDETAAMYIKPEERAIIW